MCIDEIGDMLTKPADPQDLLVVTEADPIQLNDQQQAEPQQVAMQQVAVQQQAEPQQVAMQQVAMQQVAVQQQAEPLAFRTAEDAKFETGINSQPGGCERRRRARKKVNAKKLLGNGMGITEHTHDMAVNLQNGERRNQRAYRANDQWYQTWQNAPANMQEDGSPKTHPQAITENLRYILHLLDNQGRNDLMSDQPKVRAGALTTMMERLMQGRADDNKFATLSVKRDASDTLESSRCFGYVTAMIEGDKAAGAELSKVKLLDFSRHKKLADLAVDGTAAVLQINGLKTDGTLLTPLDVPLDSLEAQTQAMRHYHTTVDSHVTRRQKDNEYRQQRFEIDEIAKARALAPGAQTEALLGLSAHSYSFAMQMRTVCDERQAKQLEGHKWYEDWKKGEGSDECIVRNRARAKADAKKPLSPDESAFFPQQADIDMEFFAASLADEEQKQNLVSNHPQKRAAVQEFLLDKLLAETPIEADMLSDVNIVQNAVSVIARFEGGILDLTTLMLRDTAASKLLPADKVNKFNALSAAYDFLYTSAKAFLWQHMVNLSGVVGIEYGKTAEQHKESASAMCKQDEASFRKAFAKYQSGDYSFVK